MTRRHFCGSAAAIPSLRQGIGATQRPILVDGAQVSNIRSALHDGPWVAIADTVRQNAASALKAGP